jgi:D-alanyl-D-alanine carboxypeptidase
MRPRSPRAVFAIALLGAATGLLSAAAAAADAPASERTAADRQLLSSMRDLTAPIGGPPLVIAVLQRGAERKVYRTGVADLARDRRANARQRMRIASTSKAISGGVALSLVAEGTLALDDTIGDWLPDQPISWHGITLRELLNHTSGLPDFTGSQAFREAVAASPELAPGPRALLEYVAGEPLNFTPGTDYEYSNSDNIAVGLIVEAATGDDYPAALRRQVFKPLGMGRSVLSPMLAVEEPAIHGYSYFASGAIEDATNVVAFGGWAWASGGIVSTPGNLSKFIRGYAGGRLFDGGTREAQYTFVPGADSSPMGPGKNSAGLALFRYETNCGTVFGHTGSILGYTQLIAASGDGRRSLTFTISTQVDDALLPALRRAERRAVCAALA